MYTDLTMRTSLDGSRDATTSVASLVPSSNSPESPEPVRLAMHAMATRFELLLHGGSPAYLRAAGEAALGEIRYWEERLSFYRPTSDVSHINAKAASEPVRVDARVFDLLQRAKQLHTLTGGAFDITIAPLMRCWGFVNNTGHLPDEAALAAARSMTGMHLVHLNAAKRTISFEKEGVQIDLGGIGKGYAIDEAIASLREDGVTSAFLHGGTSSVYGLGHPPGDMPWKTAISSPEVPPESVQEKDIIEIMPLENEALSVSAVSGKSFCANGVEYGHVLDPRSGRPVHGAMLAAVAGGSAMETDVLSTAMLVLGTEHSKNLTKSFHARTLIVDAPSPGGPHRITRCNPPPA